MAPDESSSPEPLEPTAPAPETTPADVKETPSSEVKGEKETLLEAVERAVKPAEDSEKTETPPSSESPESGTEAREGERKSDPSKDPTPEELATYKKETRERFEYLLAERKQLRSEADVTRTLREFLVSNDIAREDFQLTLDLAAAMRRGDFKSFLEGVGPYVQLATQALGITLPPDLQQEVQAGRVGFDAAAQISRERYARALAEQRATRATQFVTSQQTSQQATQLAQSIEQTVTSWEQGIRQIDPDYGRKEETVRNFLWSVVRERGNPQTPEQAVQIAQEAYNRANNTFRSFAPAPRATRQVPSSINRSGAPLTRSEPKSMMEAAMLGLERARR